MKSSGGEVNEERDADDREEGEIVDDGLEDISDNSIILTPCNGKSLRSTDHLRAISLSSVSDVEESSSLPRRRKRRSFHRRDSKHSRKKRRIKRKLSSDSDDGEAIDKKLQLQLKAAVCVDTKNRKNNLQMRLRAMTKTDKDDTPPTVEEKIDSINLVSSETEPNDDTELDNELMQLRLEALQTAIYNKYKDKKRKNLGGNLESDETNKENTGINENHEEVTPEPTKEPDSTPQSPEEDEDVLRALLLASMSKKITRKIDIEHKPVAQSNTKSFTAKPTIANYKINRLKNKPIVPKFPQVQPLIIDLNDDSDSEDDLVLSQNSVNTEAVPNIDKVLENTVDKFLKEQRQKVEAESNNNVNTLVSDKDSNLKNSVGKSVAKQPILPHKKINNVTSAYSAGKNVVRRTSLKVVNKKLISPLKPKKSSLFNKSTLNLLPEAKRREYEKLQLLLSLKKAERKPRIRRLSQRSSESNIKNKVVKSKPAEDGTSRTSTNEETRKCEILLLHDTLKEIQYKRNGSLQIHARYSSLRPLIKKIDAVSKEQKHWNQQVKRLLEELAEAREKQQTANTNMSSAIKQLVQYKEKIDKRSTVGDKVSKPLATSEKVSKPLVTSDKVSKTLVTSTPLKNVLPQSTAEINAVDKVKPMENLINKSVDHKTSRDKEVIESDSTADYEVNLGDPNDIDRIISQTVDVNPSRPKTPEKVKYISPLDPIKRVGLNDPFAIMCPFEMNGTCKDPDCTYQHFQPM